MLKLGNKVFICSSFFSEYPESVNGKVNWISKNLGEEWVKRLVLTKDKTIIHGDFLIDDKPEIKGLTKPTWKHIIFDQPYNQHFAGSRLSNWKDWKSTIER